MIPFDGYSKCTDTLYLPRCPRSSFCMHTRETGTLIHVKVISNWVHKSSVCAYTHGSYGTDEAHAFEHSVSVVKFILVVINAHWNGSQSKQTMFHLNDSPHRVLCYTFFFFSIQVCLVFCIRILEITVNCIKLSTPTHMPTRLFTFSPITVSHLIRFFSTIPEKISFQTKKEKIR